MPDTLPAPDTLDDKRRFGGVARLYGVDGAARVHAAHATVVGLGGVGSWAAEALARSGIGALTLIDLDHVAVSNTNRQVHALEGEFGKAKVVAMRERISAISPDCVVTTVEEFVTPDNVAALIGRTDVVLDCIDQVASKAALTAFCRAQQVPIVVVGAGGGRTDPTRIAYADLARVDGDPLLAKVRYRLRRHHGFARDRAAGDTRAPRKFDVPAVFSNEPVRQIKGGSGPGGGHALACAGYGSSVMVTAALGFAAAARAVELVLQQK